MAAQPPSSASPLMAMAEIFPLMVEYAPIGILLVDQKGHILHVNPKALEIFGYDETELAGQAMEILLPERFRGAHVHHRSHFMHDPQPRPMGVGRHLYARHKSGREIPVEIGLVPITTAQGAAVLASIVDITAAQTAIEHLARLGAIVEASGEAIIGLDPDGTIQAWNAAATALYGYRPEEVVGQNAVRLVPPDRMEEYRALRERIARGDQVQRLETVRLRKDGRLIQVLLSLSPLHDAEGKLTGLSTITHDVTEQRRLEQDLLHAAELEQKRIAQDLHDSLGQQLLAISFLCNLHKKKIASGAPPDVSEAEYIEALVNEAKINLRRLTRGLYAADIESQGLGACLKDLVTHTQDMSAIRCIFEGDPGLTFADRGLSENLYRLAQEALNNAVKHSFAKTIIVSLRRDGGRVTLTVADDGIGMPESLSAMSGLGVRTMRYRASIIGGSFDVRRCDPHGTIITCTVHAAR